MVHRTSCAAAAALCGCAARANAPLGVHIVHTHAGGNQHVHHVVGHLDLAYEGMEPRSEPGLLMTVVTAEPESLTAHALTLLASWAAT